jgi:hypothetical protein
VHGEVARIEDTQRQVLDAAGVATTVRRAAATSFLLGLRYLTERDTTWILEYYRNGPGFTNAELERFVGYVDQAYAQYLATGNDAALRRGANLARSGYGRPNPGRNYLYLRVSQKEPFDILYFTPALTVIANADDWSTSVTPELAYTGFNNIELRLRAFFSMAAPARNSASARTRAGSSCRHDCISKCADRMNALIDAGGKPESTTSFCWTTQDAHEPPRESRRNDT